MSQISWNAVDNDSVHSVMLDYKADDNDWISISDNEVNDGSYDWIIPNVVTDNLQVRIIVIDGVGLSDTSIVSNIRTVISYPVLESVVTAYFYNEVILKSSQSLDPLTINSETVTISSAIHTYSPLISYIDSSNSISILFEDGLATMDSITVTLSDEIKNIYGYSLDGDGDGEGGGDYVASYTTQMLADFDADGAITVEDLSRFVIGLDERYCV